MTDLFAKFEPMRARHEAMTAALGTDPIGPPVDDVRSPTRATVDGRECILLGTNNYLGLTFCEAAVEASRRAAAEMGVGTTGSRAANGNYPCHRQLERTVAEFFDLPHAVLFSTGYQANLGVLSSLAGRGDYVLIDADSHASIYDGCKLGDATVLRFRHNDADDLARRLARLDPEAGKLVVVEGVYSMLGDIAPLAGIVRAAKRGGAAVMVDEAHSLGLFGAGGRGLVEATGLEAEVDVIVGTFSKSVGAVGGFCASRHPGLEALRLAARAFLFTASMPPSLVASCIANLERMRSDPGPRRRLWRNVAHLYDGLKELGYEPGPDKSPVIGLRMRDAEEGMRIWRALLDRGIYVNLALPPATPGNACLLRCSLCAAHTREELEQVLAAFAAVREAGSGAEASEACAAAEASAPARTLPAAGGASGNR